MTADEKALYAVIAEQALAAANAWLIVRDQLRAAAEHETDVDAATLLRYCANSAERAVAALVPLRALGHWSEGCPTRSALFFAGGIDLSLAVGADDA
jgi:hypothetical protein